MRFRDLYGFSRAACRIVIHHDYFKRILEGLQDKAVEKRC